MNIKRILALVSCICLLAFGLVGCQPSAEQKAAESTAAFTGSWDINSMTIDDNVTDSDAFQSLKDQGMEVFLILTEEHEVAFCMFGDVERSAWEPVDSTTANVDLRGQTYEMKLEGDTLTMEGGSTKFEFVRGEDRDLDTYMLPEPEPTVLELNPVTIADDELCTITAVSKEVDASGNVGINLQVTDNNEAHTIAVNAEEYTGTVGDESHSMLGDVAVNTGDTGNLYLYCKATDLGGNTLNVLNNVKATLLVQDAVTYEVLRSYPLSID